MPSLTREPSTKERRYKYGHVAPVLASVVELHLLLSCGPYKAWEMSCEDVEFGANRFDTDEGLISL